MHLLGDHKDENHDTDLFLEEERLDKRASFKTLSVMVRMIVLSSEEDNLGTISREMAGQFK